MPNKLVKISDLNTPLIPKLPTSINDCFLSCLELSQLFHYLVVNKIWANCLLGEIRNYIEMTKRWGRKGYTGKINKFLETTNKFERNFILIQSIQHSMYQRNQLYRLPEMGVGLIADFNLTKGIEHHVLAYLNLQDLSRCVLVNWNPWGIRISQEIRGRQQCVTVYTWLEQKSSFFLTFKNKNLASEGRLGHSALRTYRGGEKEEGEYISFYGGDCITRPRTASCRKNVSHFHTLNQDKPAPRRPITQSFLIKSIKEGKPVTIATHIYGLNVVAINAAFQYMTQSDRRSKQAWNAYYNCSDVVLFLLDKGGLFEKANLNPNPFDMFPLITVSIFHSILLRALLEAGLKFYTINSLVRSRVKDYLAAPVEELRPLLAKGSPFYLTFSHSVLKALFNDNLARAILRSLWKSVKHYVIPGIILKNPVGRGVTVLLINGMIHASLIAVPTYVFSYQILTKKYHNRKIHAAAKANALKASAVVAIAPFVTAPLVWLLNKIASIFVNDTLIFLLDPLSGSFIRKMLSLTGFIEHSMKVIRPFNTIIAKRWDETPPKSQTKTMGEICTLCYKKPEDYSIVLASLKIISPVIVYFLFTQFGKYFYETTTTPRHVLNVAQKAEKLLTPKVPLRMQVVEVEPSLLDKIWKHRYTVGKIGIAGLTVGVFAMKKEASLQRHPINNPSLAMDSLKH